MNAQIIHTIECRKCHYPIDFNFSKMISILVGGKPVDIVCPKCNSAIPHILTGTSERVNCFLKIEKELNALLIKRLKESKFTRLNIVTPKI